jgi:hypothetical protein
LELAETEGGHTKAEKSGKLVAKVIKTYWAPYFAPLRFMKRYIVKLDG